MIWLTGDDHLDHENIINLCDRRLNDVPMEKHVKVSVGQLCESWVWKPNVDLMNAILVTRWNELVKCEDTVIHVGDFCLGKRDRVRYWTEHLRGKKLFVKGNHDHSKKTFRDAGWEIIQTDPDGTATLTMDGATFIVSHRPPTYNAACLRLQALGAGSFWVHGHSHGRANVGHPRVVDVGVDCHNFYPVPLNLIKEGYATNTGVQIQTGSNDAREGAD